MSNSTDPNRSGRCCTCFTGAQGMGRETFKRGPAAGKQVKKSRPMRRHKGITLMIIPAENPANNDRSSKLAWPQWCAMAQAFLAEYRQALVSGEAFTEYKWQEWDEFDTLEPDISVSETKRRAREDKKRGRQARPPYADRPVSDDEWTVIESRSRWIMAGGWFAVRSAQNHGHHPYQWAAKNQLKAAGKDPGNFPAIAADNDARDHRATLELARLCALSMRNESRGFVVNMDICSKYSLDDVFQAEECQRALKPLITSTFDKLSPTMKQLLKLASMYSRTGVYTAVSLNFGKGKLDKFKGKANGRMAWHKRMTTALNKALQGLPFNFVMERARSGWHLHMIVHGVHYEVFEEQHKAALLQIGGAYTPEAEDHQLVIDGGYGFEWMLGWVGYMTKDKDAILYESNALTAAGRELFAYVKAKLTDYHTRNSQITSPTQTKVLEKPAPYSSPSENVSTAILKIEAEDHTGTPGMAPLDAMLAELDKWVATNLGREDDV
ncbi:hypothetical protein [Aeromonas veronii]|uniref:hypothetical protein n=1 Tax=Aeromonas veronii TaxID=654 RepID=UPI003BA1660D